MADENKKDTRECPAKEMECLTRQEVEAYRSMFLEPGEVGARKGIFVPRELVDRLKMSVPLLDVEGLTIGVYVTQEYPRHIDNAGILNLLMEKGKKKTRL